MTPIEILTIAFPSILAIYGTLVICNVVAIYMTAKRAHKRVKWGRLIINSLMLGTLKINTKHIGKL